MLRGLIGFRPVERTQKAHARIYRRGDLTHASHGAGANERYGITEIDQPTNGCLAIRSGDARTGEERSIQIKRDELH